MTNMCNIRKEMPKNKNIQQLRHKYCIDKIRKQSQREKLHSQKHGLKAANNETLGSINSK